jgi:hypothetical protein
MARSGADRSGNAGGGAGRECGGVAIRAKRGRRCIEFDAMRPSRAGRMRQVAGGVGNLVPFPLRGGGPADCKCGRRLGMASACPRWRGCNANATGRATAVGLSHGRAGVKEWQVLANAAVAIGLDGIPCDRCDAFQIHGEEEGTGRSLRQSRADKNDLPHRSETFICSLPRGGQARDITGHYGTLRDIGGRRCVWRRAAGLRVC